MTAAGIATATTRGLAPLEDDAAPGASRWLSLNASDWDLVPVGSTLTLAVDAAGSVVDTTSGLSIGLAAQRDPAANTTNGSAPIGRLGSFLLPQASIALPASAPAGLTGQVYATVHETDPGTGRLRVLGVVPVRIDGVAAGATLQVTCTKLDGVIASSNGVRSSNATAQPSAADDLAYVDPGACGPAAALPRPASTGPGALTHPALLPSVVPHRHEPCNAPSRSCS